ncbi:uncharacterized protein METZ01_LOCUS459277, partial [marine metagenome]
VNLPAANPKHPAAMPPALSAPDG